MEAVDKVSKHLEINQVFCLETESKTCFANKSQMLLIYNYAKCHPYQGSPSQIMKNTNFRCK